MVVVMRGDGLVDSVDDGVVNVVRRAHERRGGGGISRKGWNSCRVGKGGHEAGIAELKLGSVIGRRRWTKGRSAEQ